jgi:hypothetical protein
MSVDQSPDPVPASLLLLNKIQTRRFGGSEKGPSLFLPCIKNGREDTKCLTPGWTGVAISCKKPTLFYKGKKSLLHLPDSNEEDFPHPFRRMMSKGPRISP